MNDSTPKTVTIQLTKGYVATVDECDGDLAALNWYAQTSGTNQYKVYAARQMTVGKKKQKTILLHVVIVSRMVNRELVDGEMVDHWDLDRMNNTRQNLRLTDGNGNAKNTPRRADNTSGFKGVHYQPKSNRWIARIAVNGNRVYLGCFLTAEDAYKAYCEAAIKYHGEFARLE